MILVAGFNLGLQMVWCYQNIGASQFQNVHIWLESYKWQEHRSAHLLPIEWFVYLSQILPDEHCSLTTHNSAFEVVCFSSSFQCAFWVSRRWWPLMQPILSITEYQQQSTTFQVRTNGRASFCPPNCFMICSYLQDTLNLCSNSDVRVCVKSLMLINHSRAWAVARRVC